MSVPDPYGLGDRLFNIEVQVCPFLPETVRDAKDGKDVPLLGVMLDGTFFSRNALPAHLVGNPDGASYASLLVERP